MSQCEEFSAVALCSDHRYFAVVVMPIVSCVRLSCLHILRWGVFSFARSACPLSQPRTLPQSHATRRTAHGASRSLQALPAWSVTIWRAPSLHFRDARVYGIKTTAMHDNWYTFPSPSHPREGLYPHLAHALP